MYTSTLRKVQSAARDSASMHERLRSLGEIGIKALLPQGLCWEPNNACKRVGCVLGGDPP